MLWLMTHGAAWLCGGFLFFTRVVPSSGRKAQHTYFGVLSLHPGCMLVELGSHLVATSSFGAELPGMPAGEDTLTSTGILWPVAGRREYECNECARAGRLVVVLVVLVGWWWCWWYPK